jgi:hypothetical protein
MPTPRPPCQRCYALDEAAAPLPTRVAFPFLHEAHEAHRAREKGREREWRRMAGTPAAPDAQRMPQRGSVPDPPPVERDVSRTPRRQHPGKRSPSKRTALPPFCLVLVHRYHIHRLVQSSSASPRCLSLLVPYPPTPNLHFVGEDVLTSRDARTLSISSLRSTAFESGLSLRAISERLHTEKLSGSFPRSLRLSREILFLRVNRSFYDLRLCQFLLAHARHRRRAGTTRAPTSASASLAPPP